MQKIGKTNIKTETGEMKNKQQKKQKCMFV